MTFKDTFHALIAVLTWILFIAWWNQVIPQITTEDASVAFFVIFLTVLICSVLTLLWVRYNVGISRPRDPGKPSPLSPRSAKPTILAGDLITRGTSF